MKITRLPDHYKARDYVRIGHGIYHVVVSIGHWHWLKKTKLTKIKDKKRY